jgi:hypothetical protein
MKESLIELNNAIAVLSILMLVVVIIPAISDALSSSPKERPYNPPQDNDGAQDADQA